MLCIIVIMEGMNGGWKGWGCEYYFELFWIVVIMEDGRGIFYY